MIYSGGHVKEWFEYNGHPYHFAISAGENEISSNMNFKQIMKSINAAKNVRSWLDYIEFERKINQHIRIGFVKKVEADICVYPDQYHIVILCGGSHDNVRRNHIER